MPGCRGRDRVEPHLDRQLIAAPTTAVVPAIPMDAHMKRQVMGREVVVAITAGRLDFGPWEQIFYGEFDGGRRKRVLVKVIGE